jgi:hypothetical protein
MKKILSLTLMTTAFIFGCGKEGSKSNSPVMKEAKPLEVEINGTYQALLAPINKEVSGHLNGSLTLVREGDEFIADVRFSGGPVSSLHAQNIHIGSRCPGIEDDLNNDGFIDGTEGALVYDKIIIPLDDDLSNQWRGLGTFPVTDQYGYYFWSRAASFEKMMEDLKEEDINLADEFIKLENNKSLNLLGKVVVIKGIPQSASLPETVSSPGKETPHQALPVACGTIRKLTHVPGIIDNDRTGIPVPHGETIGGSSGIDDGANFPPQSGEAGSGNYGEDETPETTDNTTEYEGTTGGLSSLLPEI